MNQMTSINPATEQVLATYPSWDASTLENHLAHCASARNNWSGSSIHERAALLRRLADQLRSQKGSLALLATQEMGKCISESEAEIEKCACVCEHYASHGEKYLHPDMIASDASLSRVVYQPLGSILGIMPWNFPYWQAFRFLAPTLIAGNTCLLKHAPNVFGCAQAIEDLFQSAGFPDYVMSHLQIAHDLIPTLIQDPRVHGVSLTGSTRAGRAVAELTGRALKPSLLELGGSDPYLILDDADIHLAAELCVHSRMLNNGQSCIAAKRWIVCKEVRDEFEEACLDMLRTYTLDDPESHQSRLGPLARKDLRDSLHQQVCKTIDLGGHIRLGGSIPDQTGFYYPATLICDPPPESPARREELFGPVACLIEAKNTEDAIVIANETPYGLGACVVTADVKRGQDIAEHHLQAGACFINQFVKSDPRLPFGGIGESGNGRELGQAGVLAFTNAKTVYTA